MEHDAVRLPIQQDAATPTDWIGRWFSFARIACLACIVVAFVVFLANIPLAVSQLGQVTPVEHASWSYLESSFEYEFALDLASLVASSLVTLACLTLAALIVWRKPREEMPLFVAFFLIIMGITMTRTLDSFAALVPTALSLIREFQVFALIPLLALLLLLFPNGKFVPGGTRWLAAALVPWTLVTITFQILPQVGMDGPHVALVLSWYLLAFVGLPFQIYRYVRVSSPAEREQTKWAVFGLALWLVLMVLNAVVYFFVEPMIPPGALHGIVFFVGVAGWPLSLLVVPLTLAIAVTRYHLFNIDIIINRALVYGSLTALIVGVYVFVVGGFGALLQTNETLAPVLLATVLVLFIVRPLYARLQHSANRLLHTPDSNKSSATGDIARAEIHPRGRGLVLARAAWFVFTALALCTLVIAIPAFLLRLGNFSFLERGMPAPMQVAPTLAFVGDLSIALVSLGTAAVSLVLAVVIFRRKPDDVVAILVSILLLFFGVLGSPLETVLALTTGWVWLAWLLDALMLVPITILFYIFPDGRFVPGQTRWLAYALGPWLSLTLVYPPLQSWSTTNESFSLLLLLWYLAWPLTAIAAQVYRYRRASNSIQRQQTKWVVLGFTLSIALVIVSSVFYFAAPMVVASPTLTAALLVVGRLINLLVPTVFAVSLAIAVLRYRLFDIDLILNRTLVYGGLSAFVVGMYVLSVGAFGALFHSAEGSSNLFISLLATAALAILFQPLRERLQRAVNRLTYGKRDDPYAVISHLGQRLEATLAPDAVLPTIVESVATALKLPYAAIELTTNDGRLTTQVHFPMSIIRSPSSVVRLPLTYQHETLGELIVAPRVGEGKLSDADLRLLNDLARQAGVAAHAVRLTADLQRLTEDLQHSRERLVVAREEERRRLRRDLHDGLGPTLAALALSASAVRDLISTDPDAAAELTTELQSEIRGTVGEIRRLVYALRPPALDELGLVAAIRESASQAGGHVRAADMQNGLRVTVEAPDALPLLPAAVEVAAFRIAQEALTNVVRHAHARNCAISISLNGARPSQLKLEILDDGVGLPAEHHAGVGLLSMRERAEELGGTFAIENTPNGGTHVVARLPIHR